MFTGSDRGLPGAYISRPRTPGQVTGTNGRAVVAKRLDDGHPDTEEIRDLAASAGYTVAGEVTQARTEDPALCLGVGKVAELADVVADGADGERIQGEIYETAKRHDIDIGDFFGVGYRLFFDEDEGPQLGYFLAKLDREFVVDRLRRER